MQNVRPRHLTDKELAHACVTESPEDIPPEWVAELAERFSDVVSINGLLTQELKAKQSTVVEFERYNKELYKELEAEQRLAREFEDYCKELEQEAADLEVRLKN
jgi:hypothetical protein